MKEEKKVYSGGICYSQMNKTLIYQGRKKRECRVEVQGRSYTWHRQARNPVHY